MTTDQQAGRRQTGPFEWVLRGRLGRCPSAEFQPVQRVQLDATAERTNEVPYHTCTLVPYSCETSSIGEARQGAHSLLGTFG